MPQVNGTVIRPLSPSDAGWVRAAQIHRWGDTTVVSRGLVHDASRLPGLVAERGETPVGLATYRIHTGPDRRPACELVTIDAFRPREGIGGMLLDAVVRAARDDGAGRVWLITTNDNTPALRFYQRRGFDLVALHRDALSSSRRLKPSIPELGVDGIPIRHELELAMRLEPAATSRDR